jgi:hypothetical protein
MKNTLFKTCPLDWFGDGLRAGWPGFEWHEADLLPPSIAAVENGETIPPLPHMSSRRGAK